LIGVIITVIITIWLTRMEVWAVFVSIMTGFVIMGVVQNIMLPICFSVTGTNPQDLAATPRLSILFFMPMAVLIALLYSLVRKYNWHIFNLKPKD